MPIVRLAAAQAVFAVAVALASTAVRAGADANLASQVELESIQGIGPDLSARIIAARQQRSFTDWPDLVARVGGVGPGNAARFSQAGLTVAGQPYSRPARPAAPASARPGAAPAQP